MDKKQLEQAKKAIENIAKKEGRTVEFVRNEMQKAIEIGMADKSVQAQRYWQSIPKKGDVPTPEEVIAHIATKTIKQL